MTGALLRRRLIFFGMNWCDRMAVFFAIMGPIASHFAERNDDILDSAAQLAQIRHVADEASKIAKSSTSDTDPYLPGAEERVASADLQANLQAAGRREGFGGTGCPRPGGASGGTMASSCGRAGSRGRGCGRAGAYCRDRDADAVPVRHRPVATNARRRRRYAYARKPDG